MTIISNSNNNNVNNQSSNNNSKKSNKILVIAKDSVDNTFMSMNSKTKKILIAVWITTKSVITDGKKKE